MDGKECFEGRKSPGNSVTFKGLISARLAELASTREEYISCIPEESQGQAQSMPNVRSVDTRMSYLRELEARFAVYGDDGYAQQRIVEDIATELAKLSTLLEDLATNKQPYVLSPGEDPADLLVAQFDLISLLEAYAPQ